MLGTVLAAVVAPNALAADAFKVEAAAASVTVNSLMQVTVECAATDPSSDWVRIDRCEVGQIAGLELCPAGCPHFDAAAVVEVTGPWAWTLCVSATSQGTVTKTFSRCRAMDPLTHTAVITHGL